MSETIYAGDDERLEFTVTSDDGTALDLTNMSIIWGLNSDLTTTPVLTKDSANTGEITIVSATEGRFDVILTPTDTSDLGDKQFYHEVELTDVDGNEFTVFQDKLSVIQTFV